MRQFRLQAGRTSDRRADGEHEAGTKDVRQALAGVAAKICGCADAAHDPDRNIRSQRETLLPPPATDSCSVGYCTLYSDANGGLSLIGFVAETRGASP